MRMNEVRSFARKYLYARGDKAELEAARNAATFENQGEVEQASVWRRVQSAINEMRGAPYS